MNEWKELKIDDLPSDILAGDYEFSYIVTKMVIRIHYVNMKDPITILTMVLNDEIKAQYRKPEPNQLSHEEIMTKWWACGYWDRVVLYNPINKMYCLNDSGWQAKDFFIGKTSADIPPEAN